MPVVVHTPPSGGSSPQPKRKNVVLWAILGAWAVGGVLGFLIVGFQKGGMFTLSDVGSLPELQGIQAKLRPLDACEMHYALRDKRGARTRVEYVHITPCDDSNERVLIKVNEAWGRNGVGFQLERSARSEPWEIRVEKDEVPFPDLLGALNEFAPILAAQYEDQKRAQRDYTEQATKATMQRAAEERARKAGAASSYPP